ncbi:hypothetical protein BC777_0930 [Yoonia maricola]|uniref:DUF8173 domain-containing protein n=1 Tax=Yoonia maricola TaxID=420999 RepID=A0A2M8WMI5_9RHOB|nr:hypothetical protein [Yoonia maricola]PJI92086.1 hypothetical protein BC777_0930 [Yoonia maricola]
MRHLLIATVASLALAGPGLAQDVSRTHGGDTYMAGEAVADTLSATGDVFAAGSVITTSGSASGDIHAAGYDVDVSTQTGGDLYAAGSTVTISGTVGEDVTAAGFSVRSSAAAAVAGNLRFFGRNLTIEGPVTGALTAFGGKVYLNAPVSGDAWIVAKTLTFGPEARIDGALILSADDEISVPERVIPAARITREEWNTGETYRAFNRSWEGVDMPMLPTWMSLFSAFLISTIFLLLLAAIFLTLVPNRVEKMRRRVTRQPLQTFLLGVIGLSALFGMVPVTALTIIGIPFVPFALLAILVVWTLGYLLAAYGVARRIVLAFNGDEDPSFLMKLVTILLAICAVAILNFIPFVGWVVNYTLVLLGVGAMTAGLLSVFITDPDPALDVDMRERIEE